MKVLQQLPPALAALGARRQWITWRKTPDPLSGKMNKMPCNWQSGIISNSQDTANWTSFENARDHAHLADKGDGAGVGFVFSVGDPFWFVDIDNCYADEKWSPLALDLCRRLGGAAVEVSQSEKGLHIIGSGPVPKHRCKNIPLGLELYTEGRFIAITGEGAYGDAGADITDAIGSVVTDYFLPKANSGRDFDEWTNEPCEEWRGPEDDEDLIRRACKTKPRLTTADALRPGSGPARASFKDLWDADVTALALAFPENGTKNIGYDASSADLALATHLAFWTGRDCERIERLMRLSDLRREKYESSYYMDRTVRLAAGSVEKVCQDKEKPAPLPSIAVRIEMGSGGDIALSEANQNDKTHHLGIAWWFHAAGFTASHDEFANRVLLNGKPLTDEEELDAWLRVRALSHLKIAKELFGDVLRNIAWNNRFHPLRNWLDDVQPTWDGTPRLDNWMTTYLGVEDTEYTRAIGAIFLTAAVRRARRPGAKFDEIIILEGPQGIEKSTAIACLCPSADWFCDDFNVSMDSRELLEATEGKWIVEAPELSKLNKSEVEHVKHMLSRQVDRARKAYGRTATERGRQWVGFATTNADKYLTDPTGNRRFWPVRVGSVDLAGIMCDREQLWAEAAQREAAGGTIRLDKRLWAVAAIEQDKRVEVDPFSDILEPLIGHYESGIISAEDIWQRLAIPVDRRPSMTRKVGDTMRRMGWTHSRRRENGERMPCYVKGGEFPKITWDNQISKFNPEKPNLAVV